MTHSRTTSVAPDDASGQPQDAHLRVVMLLHKSVVHDSRVRREASTLAAAGHDVTVIELSPDADGQLDGFKRRSASPPGWLRRVLPFHIYRTAFLAGFLRQVVRLRPDVIHAHDAAMLLPGLFGARLTGARLVYDSHELASSVPYRERSWAWFVGAIERLALPRCAAVITVSDGIAERLREIYGLRSRPVVLRNVSALSVGEGDGGPGLRERLGLTDEPLVLHQGACAQDRGCEVLARAVALLDGVHLCFLGDAEAADDACLRREVDELGIGARTHFVPAVELGRLLAYTAEADVGVSLLQDTCENHRLALPNKLFEYLAAGVPVVVSDLPEMASLVRCAWRRLERLVE